MFSLEAIIAVIIFSICACVAIYRCYLRLKLIYTTDNLNQKTLLKSGLFLLALSGMALACLTVVSFEITSTLINDPFLKEISSRVISALSWFIPLVFAGVGVNIISEAILKKQNANEYNKSLKQDK